MPSLRRRSHRRSATPPPRPAEPAATFRDAFHGRWQAAPAACGSCSTARRPGSTSTPSTGSSGSPPRSSAPDDAVDTDHLLLAAALYLRSVVDPGGGWGEAARSDQLREVREELVAAADGIAAGSAGPVVVAHRLATLLAGSPLCSSEWFADVVKALRIVGADGLLYLAADHRLLLSAATGALAPAPSALPARLVVVGDGPLPDGSIVSWVRSGAQLVALAGRTRRPVGDDAVFVANPRGDRRGASMEALLLRRTFYPRSTGLGDTGENASAAGTPDEVRGRLDASLLHLGCGVTADGGLELAGPAVLERAEIEDGQPAATGGLAMLPPADGADGAGRRPPGDAVHGGGPLPGRGARRRRSIVYFLLARPAGRRGRRPGRRRRGGPPLAGRPRARRRPISCRLG